MECIARTLSQHQIAVVVVAYVAAFALGVAVTFLDKTLTCGFRLQVVFIFLCEFVLLFLVLVLIDGVLKIQKTAAIQRPNVQDIQEFATRYGAIFVLFLLEYLIIVLSCGLKFWRIYACGSRNGKQEGFKVDLAKTPKAGLLDWILYSAENVVPGLEHGGITPLSTSAKLFSIGQMVGNVVVTILLLRFTVYLLGFHGE